MLLQYRYKCSKPVWILILNTSSYKMYPGVSDQYVYSIVCINYTYIAPLRRTWQLDTSLLSLYSDGIHVEMRLVRSSSVI